MGFGSLPFFCQSFFRYDFVVFVPVYMMSVLGVATSWIGILEGIVEGLSFFN